MEIDKDSWHHAYLVLGEREFIKEGLLATLKEMGVSTVGNPDLFFFEEELFGVEEARKLSDRAEVKAFTGKKVFILSPARITTEAQNALLKLFEEPVADTHFFLILREESLVLPTLLSRMRILRSQNSGLADLEGSTPASDFLALPIKKRLAFAKKFADDEKNLPVFLDDMLLALRSQGASASLVQLVYNVRRYASDRSASSRLMLEHLALVL